MRENNTFPLLITQTSSYSQPLPVAYAQMVLPLLIINILLQPSPIYNIGCCANPLPGRLSGTGFVFVTRGSISVSAGPNAGTSGSEYWCIMFIMGLTLSLFTLDTFWPILIKPGEKQIRRAAS